MSKAAAAAIGLISLGYASGSALPERTLRPREIPQEHSHDLILSITQEALLRDNPKNIEDAVFGLVGIQSAASGAGSVTNLDCLRQEIADQAFTNGRAIKDLRLMAGALIYQTLEVNTGKVGMASASCADPAINAEIGALSQHQDPASPSAGRVNRQITLELAKRLKGIGADPNLALLSGTFAPGDVNDLTAKGNTCNALDAQLGCIYRSGKLVLDVSMSDIKTAVADTPQTFTGTGGIYATDLVDMKSFSAKNFSRPGDGANISTNDDSKGMPTTLVVSLVAGSLIVGGLLVFAAIAWRRSRRHQSILETNLGQSFESAEKASIMSRQQVAPIYQASDGKGQFEMDAIAAPLAELPATRYTGANMHDIGVKAVEPHAGF